MLAPGELRMIAMMTAGYKAYHLLRLRADREPLIEQLRAFDSYLSMCGNGLTRAEVAKRLADQDSLIADFQNGHA
jgi:hypothetical protein